MSLPTAGAVTEWSKKAIVIMRRESGEIKSPKRRLRLEYSGNLIKHLGLSMYGGPVPALAELIANAWDADASRVVLKIPLDKPVVPSQRITIVDDGRGMTWEEVERNYLVIGRNRRHDGSEATKNGRPIMGRKGIGKLAGFGIAKIVEVRTVRNKWLTHFRMNYDDMTSDLAPHARYEPQILADEACREPNSTTVVLESLQLKRAIPGRQFIDSLSRRFAVLDDTFVVKVNEQTLRKAEMPMLYRYPAKNKGTAEVDITGFGSIRYWYGFTEKPIEDEDARGLAIYVRGRMASLPSRFGITGGVWNQAALEYLTGEVYADELDEVDDLINTNRQEINWKEPSTAALQAWGQKLIKDAAREYDEIKKAQVRDKVLGKLDDGKQGSVKDHLARLPDRIARIANKLIFDYHSIAEGKAVARSLEDSVDAIMELSAAAVPVAKQRDALSDVHAVISKRRQILDELSVAPKADRQRILRSNPWIMLSPWRIAVNDPAATRTAVEARESYSSLTNVPVWVITFENRHYLVALCDTGNRTEKSLVALSARLARQAGLKKVAVIMVCPAFRLNSDGVRVTTIQKLVEAGLRDCKQVLAAIDERGASG